jgi:hypothetical protein
LRLLGATTTEEYRKYIEKDAALARRFQTVSVEEPTVLDTINILRGLREKYEMHHGVKISEDAIVSATKLSSRYMPDRRLVLSSSSSSSSLLSSSSSSSSLPPSSSSSLPSSSSSLSSSSSSSSLSSSSSSLSSSSLLGTATA